MTAIFVQNVVPKQGISYSLRNNKLKQSRCRGVHVVQLFSKLELCMTSCDMAFLWYTMDHACDYTCHDKNLGCIIHGGLINPYIVFFDDISCVDSYLKGFRIMKGRNLDKENARLPSPSESSRNSHRSSETKPQHLAYIVYNLKA